MVEANPSTEQNNEIEAGQATAQERTTTSQINGQIRYYEWNEDMTREAAEIIDADARPKLTEMGIKRLELDASRNWDIFYKHNTTNFYKDRHYLAREFTELSEKLEEVKQG